MCCNAALVVSKSFSSNFRQFSFAVATMRFSYIAVTNRLFIYLFYSALACSLRLRINCEKVLGLVFVIVKNSFCSNAIIQPIFREFLIAFSGVSSPFNFAMASNISLIVASSDNSKASIICTNVSLSVSSSLVSLLRGTLGIGQPQAVIDYAVCLSMIVFSFTSDIKP